MTIYLDVIFLENICMNYIILYATAIVSKTARRPARILIGSLLGAAYAVLMVMNVFEIYSSVILKIILSIIIVYISIETTNFKSLIKDVLIFYLISFTFGGVALALMYFIKPEDILMKNGIYIGTYPIKIALMGGVIGFAIVSIVFNIIKNKFIKNNTYCKIEILLNNKRTTTEALIDTGNFLKEPITGTPVIIVEQKILREIIPEIIINNTENIINGKMEVFEEIQNREELDTYISKFRVIPFSSLGKQNGLLLGLKTDNISIFTDDECVKSKDVIVAIYDKILAKDGKYRAIISAEILNN